MNYTSMLRMLDYYDNYSVEEFLRVSQEYTDNHWFSSKSAEIAVIVCFAVLSFVGLLGNGLVFYVIAKKGWKQSSRNWYILNLAGSDILTCVLCKPLTVVRIVLKNWVLGDFLCKVVPSLQTVYVFVSTFTLVALAVDRYSAIIYNNHQTRFKLWVYVCLGVIWLLAFGISAPLVVVTGIEHVRGYNDSILYSVCFEKWQSTNAMITYTALLVILQYLSPLIAIVTLHLLIGNFLRARFRILNSEDQNVRRKRRRHRKNMLLLSSMAISFGVAWFPLHFVNALGTIDHSAFADVDHTVLHAVCMMIAFSSVCMNPLIYGLLNTNFRRDLVKLCGRNPSRCSVFTDYTRRSSPQAEQLGLISATNQDFGFSNTNLTSRIRASCNHILMNNNNNSNTSAL